MQLPTIALDMDGTIADFYGVEGWLDNLQNEDATPYITARGAMDMRRLNHLITLYQSLGGHVCVVSWTSRGDISQAFYTATQAAKMLWLQHYLPSIHDVRIVRHGTPKYAVVKNVANTVLFDDELENRKKFEAAGGKSYEPEKLLSFLLAFTKQK